MSIPPTSIALERLLMRKRALSGGLLYNEMFDRWGPRVGPEFERVRREEDAIRAEYDQTVAELTTRARRAQAEEPEAIHAWVDAHVKLLERFIEDHPGEDASTGRFVAAREIEQWREVAAGTRAYVDENTVYVSIDSTLHRELFGDL